MAISGDTIEIGNPNSPKGSAHVFMLVVDSDGDRVLDDDDVCDGTVIPDPTIPTKRLGTNRWALVDDEGASDTFHPKGKAPRRSYTIADPGAATPIRSLMPSAWVTVTTSTGSATAPWTNGWHSSATRPGLAVSRGPMPASSRPGLRPGRHQLGRGPADLLRQLEAAPVHLCADHPVCAISLASPTRS